MTRILIILTAILTLASCSTEEICGNITSYDYNCNSVTTPDCVYYIYVDGKREVVTYSTWNEARIGDYICLESVW